MTQRNPMLDPQPGDIVRTDKGRSRKVIKQVENDVVYIDHLGKPRNCWLDD